MGKEGECHLTSVCTDDSPQTSQLASLPVREEQKRLDGGLGTKDSLQFKQQSFLTGTAVCTEEAAPRAGAPLAWASSRSTETSAARTAGAGWVLSLWAGPLLSTRPAPGPTESNNLLKSCT